MMIARIPTWKWVPRFFKAGNPGAPFQNIIHIGFWLILWGKPK